jgi:hypothetical protein
VKRHVFAILVALSSVALGACSAPSYSIPAPVAPPGPAVHTIKVTALHVGRPISGLAVSLTQGAWPGGAHIAGGKTGPDGKVKLSGKWSNQEVVCVGAQYELPSGYTDRVNCGSSYPNAITFYF